jgi:TPR repeat protein
MAHHLAATERGSGDAAFELSMLYATGLGVDRDPATALEWYTKAANSGHAKSAYTAAVMHLTDDRGLPVDEEQAAVHFSQAEELGFDVDAHLAMMGLARPDR